MYILDLQYIQQEAKKVNLSEDSEFVDVILGYDDVLPNELYDVFNPNINHFRFPVGLCRQIQKKHGANWVSHRRYHEFNLPGESFETCNQRLIKKLLDSTDCPIFIKL